MKEQLISTSRIISYYQAIGIDLKEMLKDIDHFELFIDEKIGYYKWLPSIEGDSLFYEKLSRLKKNYYEYRLDHKYAVEWLRGKNNVLDIGCGGGAFLSKLKNIKKYGLEPNKTCHKKLVKEGINILNSISELPEKIEAVTIFHVLEHVSNPIQFIEEIIPYIKEGGELIISVPAMESFIGADTNSILNSPPHHLTKWTKESLSNLLNHFNLEVNNIQHLNLESSDFEAYLQYLISNSLSNKTKIDRLMIRFINKLIRMKNPDRKKIPFYIPGHNHIVKGIKK